MSSTIPKVFFPRKFTLSPILKGLKIAINIPLTIFEKACCDANPIIIAKIPEPAKIETTDQWLLSSLDSLINRCLNGYAKLDFSIPAENLYNWIWNLFAAHYIELVKSRAYGEDNMDQNSINSARYTLHTALKTILKLLASKD